MRTNNRPPAHPGRILRNHYLEPLSITIVSLAKILDVSRKTASKIVNERGSITPNMALRLSRAFSTSPDLWMNLQKNYSLWHAAQDSKAWQNVRPAPGITDSVPSLEQGS
jgi:addiction module HigA family antidote